MDTFKRSSNQTTLGEAIEKLLKAYRLDGKMKELDIIESWPDLMGIAVANRTKSLQIRNKKLILQLDSSVMRDELAHGKQIIIDRVNEKAGFEIVNDIWFS